MGSFLAPLFSQTPYQLDSMMIVVRDGDDYWDTKEWKFRELLNIARDKGYTLQETYLLRFMGVCANELTEYYRAIDLYEDALIIAEANGYDNSCASIIDNMANSFGNLGDFENASYLYLRVFCNSYPNDTIGLIRNYHNQALLYGMEEQFEESKIFIDSLLTYGKVEGAEIYINTGLWYQYFLEFKLTGNPDMVDSIKKRTTSDSKGELVEMYNTIADMYRELGAYDSSLVYYNLTLRCADTLNYQFYMSGANRNISELNGILYDQNKKKETWIWGLSGALVTLVALLFLVWRTIQQKRKIADQELKIKNQEVNRLLQDQELASTQAMLQGQDKERRRIAEELHDRLGSMLATVKLHFGHVEDVLEKGESRGRDQFGKAEVLLNEACEEVRRISHDLHSGVLMKFGLKAALEQLQETVIDSAGIKVQFITTGLTGRLPFEAEMNLYRVVQELVANTIKYSGATKITLQISLQGDELNMIYEDNGKGFDLAKVKRGIGLENIENRVKRLDGQLHIDTTLGYGMTAIIEIPLVNDTSSAS